MCLTTEALVLFLNLLPFDKVTTAPDRVVIEAETRSAHWVDVGGRWCTLAPQIDRAERFAALRAD
ncbi:hypothetical protein [Sagittula stellata]|uniref:Uncharacterized protein n=1 Tax=Sagittula stellata (strain ATCC 700073 / DSM 11524 / E-37) TaxID=388399 RepID=A3K8D1_SAGS3|nr:hypothetical protein [Sagittula stellata]EBA06610.1 hypothetical protein SSE37_10153 [Sagittula stellata E-37]